MDVSSTNMEINEPDKDPPSFLPPTVANWRDSELGLPRLAGAEYPLFSDAWLTGEQTLGPYRFINTVAGGNLGFIKTVLILRYWIHREWDYPDFRKTDSRLYHAGSPPEELAALASLCMGVRLRAGCSTRRFELNGDELGRPEEIGDQSRPYFERPRSFLIPNAGTGMHSVDSIARISSLPVLRPNVVVALIRAARLYQDAMWLCESDPELAWLLMVSAVEVAANCWRADQGDNVGRMQLAQPALCEQLANRPDLMLAVAEAFAPTMGATKKFLDFCIEFLPTAPVARPEAWAQIDWQAKELKRALNLVYKYRSDALHSGIPFPAPMCSPPYNQPEWPAPAERLLGSAIHQGGGTWLAKDLPLTLHLFEHVVRETILRWWESEAADAPTKA